MRMLSARVHAMLDYIAGLLLISLPWLLGLSSYGVETWTMILVGAALLTYSLFTKYLAGAFPLLPLRLHLWLDVLGGGLLIVSPWILLFYSTVWLPHLALGFVLLFMGLLSTHEHAFDRSEAA